MVENNDKRTAESARAFFNRAEEVASVDNYDYAVELYIEGIRRWPEAVEEGHKPLRKLALLRQADGGKKPGIKERFSKTSFKDPVEELTHAEYLFSKDPENVGYAEMIIKAARKGGFNEVLEWISKLLLYIVKNKEKRPFSTLMQLKEAFSSIEHYEEAAYACRLAKQAKPGDMNLDDEIKNLMAKQTIQKGRYDTGDDYRKAVQDMDKQEELQQKDAVHKTDSYRVKEVQQLEERLKQTPDSQNLRLEYAKKAAQLEDPKLFMEVCQKLNNWHKETRDFAYQRALGEIIIRDLKAKIRHTKSDIETHGKTEKNTARLRELVQKLSEAELQHYTGCVENYPTEANYKYELGVRLMQKKKYDEAIPLFQKSRNRPSLRISSLNMLGMCFFNKGWYADAVDIFEEALKQHTSDYDDIYKELRYNLARALEHGRRFQQAYNIYRKLAQLDYSYRDVSTRVNKLRAQLE
ncbi:tetratricopeptide repeat protein [Sedimentisphaera salicampi]|uniref:tetratricopeptide repeat protein n=1 Tax=Sedimentisphaera salicampi TaxID=1941349 RepID=UPI000B9C0DFB|nr:tetratricopeptide repeat protein [Sedimentisphaera salicampi]OXU14266.1 putative O-linked N-acetylglucosamine transferase, SPINDLY family [Sedimentisphaera salicampi]